MASPVDFLGAKKTFASIKTNRNNWRQVSLFYFFAVFWFVAYVFVFFSWAWILNTNFPGPTFCWPTLKIQERGFGVRFPEELLCNRIHPKLPLLLRLDKMWDNTAVRREAGAVRFMEYDENMLYCIGSMGFYFLACSTLSKALAKHTPEKNNANYTLRQTCGSRMSKRHTSMYTYYNIIYILCKYIYLDYIYIASSSTQTIYTSSQIPDMEM